MPLLTHDSNSIDATENTPSSHLHLAVIGHPIHHSVSPKLHAGFAQEMNASSIDVYHQTLKVSYEAEHVIPDVLEAWFEEVKHSQRLRGFNLTLPHKQAILPLLDTLTPEAEVLGAVNTMVLDRNTHTWIGHNTDGMGAWLALHPTLRTRLRSDDGHAIFLGIGGSAKAVASTLVREGVQRFTLIARDLKKAEAFKHHLQVVQCHSAERGDTPIRVELLVWPKTVSMWVSTLRRLSKGVLIQTTPMGMVSHEGQDRPIPQDAWLEAFPPDTLCHESSPPDVFDLIYTPLTTALMHDANTAGANIVQHGLGMLVLQGALAFEYWTGYAPLVLQDARSGVLYETHSPDPWEKYAQSLMV
ncbi:MAG: shikimate dehydrogenase family protein [Vampirovibrionales bacterium]